MAKKKQMKKLPRIKVPKKGALEEAIQETYERECQIAYETETPPVYVEEDSCPMAARILADLCGSDDEDDYADVRYYDEDGNEIDPSEIDPDEWEEVTDEEAEEFNKKEKPPKRKGRSSSCKKR